MPSLAGVHQQDRDLRVVHAAGGAGVLALDPHRLGALLQIAGLVHHQHRPRVLQVLDQVGAEVVTHPVVVPRRAASSCCIPSGATAATWAAVAAVYLALWPVLGSLDGLFDALAFVGSDGGRLAVVGPVLAVLLVARAVVITPLAEELLFRGAVYGWLLRWWPARATIAATAAAFASIHGFLVVMPAALVFGIVTGWLRERTGSVAAGFVTHVLSLAMLAIMTFLLTG